MRTLERNGWTPLAFALATLLAGCGTPGAPQPPSLDLPDQVADLSAVRVSNQVSLTWTMPRRNTDKLLLKSGVEVRVCRREGAGSCNAAGRPLPLDPGKTGEFAEPLPPALASGAPRVLSYFVELTNRKGRSAGVSNAAVVLAGEAPSPVTGLKAEVRKDGVVLRWTPDAETAAVRLERKLLTPAATRPQPGLMTLPPEPLEQNLLVDPAQEGRAVDKNASLAQTYEYRAQRVKSIVVEGKTLELASELSPALRVETTDVFPPAVPTGLSAVATVGDNSNDTAIDLSWQPDIEPDLAGYIVYRGEGSDDWLRISPPPPGVAPAFHDAHVQPGHTYRYAVSAVGNGGYESPRSVEAEETVPNP
jgi:hypothetical protein